MANIGSMDLMTLFVPKNRAPGFSATSDPGRPAAPVTARLTLKT